MMPSRREQPMTMVPEVHPMETPQAMERLRKIEGWWQQARQAQAESRYEMAIDQDFYDGLQWSDSDRLELQERGQMPLVFNRIKPSIDWILGSEKHTRVDFRVYPRGEEDADLAEVKTNLLKYVSDVNKTGFARSRAFADAVIVGVGWLEDGMRTDPYEEPLYSRSEDWRNIWYDHLSASRDLSDARYIFRAKWVDLDVAQAMFPDRSQRLQAAAEPNYLNSNTDDEFYWLNSPVDSDGRTRSRLPSVDSAALQDTDRDRVRLVECWYRVPAKVQILRGDPRHEGDHYNPDDPDMVGLVESGHASLVSAIRMVVRCAIFVDGGLQSGGHGGAGILLQDVQSPYRHQRFPFTPIWGYRRGRDRTAYGVVRNLRDIQEDLNKRRSKALYILSTNKLLADNNAFEDWDEVAEEMYRPDGILRKRPGSEVQLFNETRIATEHIQLEQINGRYLQDVSGVTDENLGRQTNAQSGKAIIARQEQGTLVTAEFFDSLRFAIQHQGEIMLSLIEQYYDTPKVVRLLGPRGAAKFLRINEEVVNEQGLPHVVNDITAKQADFIVDSQNYRESIRVAMYETLMDLCGKLPPEVTFNMLDLVIDLSDLPHKDELVDRIRKLNGQADPDGAVSPEEEAELMAKQEAEAEAAEMEKQMMAAQLAEQEAKAKKLDAESDLAAERAVTEQVKRSVEEARLILDAEESVRSSQDDNDDKQRK